MSKDPQKHRLYDSEQVLDKSGHFRSLEQMQKFVDDVVASGWWTERANCTKVTVFLGRRDSSKAKSYKSGSWRGQKVPNPFITIPPTWAADRATVLHELAHVVTESKYEDHGPEYAANYISIVRTFLGPYSAIRLQESMDANRVSYSPENGSESNIQATKSFHREIEAKSELMAAAEAFMKIGKV